MPLFGQDRRAAGVGGPYPGRPLRRDPLGGSVLPVWTPFSSIDFHRRLLALVRAELVATGLPYAFDDAGSCRTAVDDRDVLVDLRALAQATAVRPLREWPELVRNEVTRLVAAAQAATRFCAHPPPGADAGPLLALTVSTGNAGPGRRSLVGSPAGGAEPTSSPAGSVPGSVPGLVAELVYDLPTGVLPVPEQHLQAWSGSAGTVERLWSAAAENTRVRVRAVLARARVLHGGYDVVAHPSPFTASVVLCMDELAGPVTPYGVLFAVPSRTELVAHVVTGAAPAADALRDLPAGVRRRHARVAAPLSPALYRWRDGEVSPVPPDADLAEFTGSLVRTS